MGTVLKPKCAKCGAPTLRRPHPCGLHFCSEACERATREQTASTGARKPLTDDQLADALHDVARKQRAAPVEQAGSPEPASGAEITESQITASNRVEGLPTRATLFALLAKNRAAIARWNTAAQALGYENISQALGAAPPATPEVEQAGSTPDETPYLGAPLCPHCQKPKIPGWTDAEVKAGRRFNAQTNTMEYHCYERYVD